MLLLVSLCNLPQPGSSGLLLVDLEGKESDQAQFVDIGATPSTVRGCLGLWAGTDVIHCAWLEDTQRSCLTVLDRQTLTVLDSGWLEDAADVHSVCVDDGWIYVASTGTDEVRRLPASRVGGRSEVVWRASTTGRDTHHVNAVLASNGQLLCSAFGPKSGTRWSTALSGYVADLVSNRILWRKIEHPHSLAQGPDDLYVAESRRARVRGLASGRGFPMEGYARGLAFLPDGRALAGVSRGRAHSRHLGTIENPDDPGDLAGDVSVTVFTMGANGGTPEHTIDLAVLGPEIYDVVVLR